MNAFADYAAAAKPAFEKRKERIRDARLSRKAQAQAEALAKVEEEEEILQKIEARRRKAHLKALMAGRWGEEFKALRSFLRTMTIEQAGDLVGMVELSVSTGWMSELDADHRHDVLDLISRAITSLRERNDMTPFDDPLPGEPLNAFHLIREMLHVR